MTMNLPPKLTPERVLEAAEEGEGIGFCLACGEETSGVEPDARQYPCEYCGENQVYGAEEVVLMIS